MVKIKKLKLFKYSLIVISILGLLLLHFYVPRFITEIKNPVIEIIRGKHLITTSPSFDNNKEKGKHINFSSFDKTELSVYLTLSSADSVKGTIILLHGIRSNKESFIELSKYLSKNGYNSVALDSRGHGASQGVHCTFGAKEKKDIAELINVLNQEENINNNIGIWGQSLGGAIGLQAMGYDSRINFGVIESTFSDFRTIANDYFNYHLGFNFKPFTNYLISRAGTIADFDVANAKPIKYCEQIRQPILMVHGNQDQRISIEYARKNYSAIPSSKKEFLEINNASHINVWKVGGKEYFNRVLAFLNKSRKNEIK